MTKPDLPPDKTPEGLAVYVHWPFCLSKCPYCDFNSHVPKSPVDTGAFTDGLIRELETVSTRLPGRTVKSVFFGGGTPSLMPPSCVGRIIDHIDRLFPIASDAELTLEANPTSVEADNFSALRSAGINRVSVGIQSLNDQDLKRLGRLHTVPEALGAFELAVKIFPRTSFDLIYARPGQTEKDWEEELARALGYQDGHMSLYQLTIEPDTAFADLHAAGKLVLPLENTSVRLFDLTSTMTLDAGLVHYETSNYARTGKFSQHNLNYWRYGEYAGIGPGAHSRLINTDGTRLAIANVRDPAAWLKSVRLSGAAMETSETLHDREQGEEYVLMAMRLREGINLKRLEREFGIKPDAQKISALEKEGLIKSDAQSNALQATTEGMHVLNTVISEMLS